jgi:hypothetical protein
MIPPPSFQDLGPIISVPAGGAYIGLLARPDIKSHSELRTSCNPSFFKIVNYIEYGSGCCEKKVVLYLSRDAGSGAEAAQEAGGLIAEEMLS